MNRVLFLTIMLCAGAFVACGRVDRTVKQEESLSDAHTAVPLEAAREALPADVQSGEFVLALKDAVLLDGTPKDDVERNGGQDGNDGAAIHFLGGQRELAEEETFDCEWNDDEQCLDIMIRRGGVRERCISVETYWGAWRVSENGKRLVFWLKVGEKGIHPLYFLNGESGGLDYIGNYSSGVRPDKNVRYLISSSGKSKNEFIVINLQENEIVTSFTWNLKNNSLLEHITEGFSFYPSQFHDFKLRLEVESYTGAEATFDVLSGLNVVFDVTDQAVSSFKRTEDLDGE